MIFLLLCNTGLHTERKYEAPVEIIYTVFFFMYVLINKYKYKEKLCVFFLFIKAGGDRMIFRR